MSQNILKINRMGYKIFLKILMPVYRVRNNNKTPPNFVTHVSLKLVLAHSDGKPREACSVQVLNQCYAPLSPGLGVVCAFCFLSILASEDLSLGYPVFLLYLRLGFLNKFWQIILFQYQRQLAADVVLHLNTLAFLGWVVSCV